MPEMRQWRKVVGISSLEPADEAGREHSDHPEREQKGDDDGERAFHIRKIPH